ncbi:Uncharacterized protein OBRU01_03355, partial [Operophtera brumata]
HRIAGGETTPISEYPFSVALLTNSGQGSYTHACGGAILTNNAILSAASCFYTNQEANPVSWWRARVGSSGSNAGGTIYFINRITANPGFSPTTLANDIAVIRTTLAIPLVPGSVEVARVAGAAFTFTTNQINQDQSSSAELRKVDLYVVDQQTCTNRYNEIGFTVTGDMVCAGWLDVGGDSGSPILSDRTVVGVFSKSEGCAQGWYPAINTRLAPYLSWVVSAAYA